MAVILLKSILKHLRNTPFHPQWIVFKKEHQLFQEFDQHLDGTIVDIGCSDMKVKKYLDQRRISYIGIDYPGTATNWYGTSPDIFADGHRLPLPDAQINGAICLQVLEHVTRPDIFLSEIYRVLRPGKNLILAVPFMYPIHDSPRDFHRWTDFGLSNFCEATGFKITKKVHLSTPPETLAILLNVALGKYFSDSIIKKNPGILLLPIFPVFCLINNLIASILKYVITNDSMSYGYQFVLTKPKEDKL